MRHCYWGCVNLPYDAKGSVSETFFKGVLRALPGISRRQKEGFVVTDSTNFSGLNIDGKKSLLPVHNTCICCGDRQHPIRRPIKCAGEIVCSSFAQSWSAASSLTRIALNYIAERSVGNLSMIDYCCRHCNKLIRLLQVSETVLGLSGERVYVCETIPRPISTTNGM